MLKHKTLLVVGAGASADFKLPLGPSLAEQICRLMPSSARLDDSEFAYHLSRSNDGTGARSRIYSAAQHIKHNLPLAASIDSYLDSHRACEWRIKVAKMAIAHLIGAAEAKSSLSCRHDGDAQNFDFARMKGTWLQALWTVLHVGITPADRQRIFENLRIATFNYDRCIEQFFRLAICNFFGATVREATEIVDQLSVLHIYGSLGALPNHVSGAAPFNPDTESDAGKTSENIRTFTEPVSEAAEALPDMIAEAEQIIFLGFSFGIPNLQLIEGALPKGELQRRVYATVYEMDEDRVEAIRHWIDRLFSRGFAWANLRNCKGSDLINKFSPSW